MGYHYNPTRKALVRPAEGARFFAGGRPTSEPVLSAELSRLAYAAFDRDPTARTELEATLRRVGFSRCTVFSAGSTQAFLAQDPTTPLSVLAFRGTELDPRDWATDLDALLMPWPGGGQVHKGFAEALNTMWSAVAAALATVTGRVLYAGHSLGAALATLAAARRPPHALFTFGSPRVGDALFAQAIATLDHHRYTNCCDIVCRVPPEALGYHHAGPAAYLDRTGQLHSGPTDSFVTRDQAKARRRYLWRWAWRPGTVWTRDAADHAPVNYLSALVHATHSAP